MHFPHTSAPRSYSIRPQLLEHFLKLGVDAALISIFYLHRKNSATATSIGMVASGVLGCSPKRPGRLFSSGSLSSPVRCDSHWLAPFPVLSRLTLHCELQLATQIYNTDTDHPHSALVVESCNASWSKHQNSVRRTDHLSDSTA